MSGAPDNTTVAPTIPATPAPAATGTPVTPQSAAPPVAAPVAASSEPVPVAQTVEATPAPVIEPAKVETPAAAPADKGPEPSLLDGAPVEAKPVEAAPTVDPAAPVEPAPLPAYEAYTLPEGVTVEAAEVGKFNELIGKLEQTGKVDHAAMQAFGQEAINFHIAQVTAAIAKHEEAGAQAWSDMRNAWRDEFKKDKALGGNRQNTTLAAANAMIEQFGGSKEQVNELRNVLRTTGAGDNVAVIRLIANIAKVLGEGKPVPATNPKPPQLASKKTRRYSANGANGAA